MIVPLFKNVPEDELKLRRDAAWADVVKTRESMLEKERAYEVALQRYTDTNIYAGLTFAANQHWAALVEHEQAVNMHAQFKRDSQ
jgi:hypothetical protein